MNLKKHLSALLTAGQMRCDCRP